MQQGHTTTITHTVKFLHAQYPNTAAHSRSMKGAIWKRNVGCVVFVYARRAPNEPKQTDFTSSTVFTFFSVRKSSLHSLRQHEFQSVRTWKKRTFPTLKSSHGTIELCRMSFTIRFSCFDTHRTDPKASNRTIEIT